MLPIISIYAMKKCLLQKGREIVLGPQSTKCRNDNKNKLQKNKKRNSFGFTCVPKKNVLSKARLLLVNEEGIFFRKSQKHKRRIKNKGRITKKTKKGSELRPN